jgi:thymidine kinase
MAKLYFYYASMNAGKSTTLLQADFNYRERGMADAVDGGAGRSGGDMRSRAGSACTPRRIALAPGRTSGAVMAAHAEAPLPACWSMRRSS